MIVLFSDFGEVGPYVGQMKAVLGREAPGVPMVDLVHDAPAFQAKPSSYLLSALIDVFPTDVVFLCVVDPGVGSDRAPVVAEADGRRFVGPDNGLFEVPLRRANTRAAWRITWEPPALSASFHGRDLFAPVAAMLARGDDMPGVPIEVDTVRRVDWPDDLAEVVYIDTFGNAMTGIRARELGSDTTIDFKGQSLPRARTFSDLPPGSPFWYENSSGLAEIAVNQGRAVDVLEIAVGDGFKVSNG